MEFSTFTHYKCCLLQFKKKKSLTGEDQDLTFLVYKSRLDR